MTFNYYPLVRGRQFDLLALQSLPGKNIMPIIEPVKDNPTLNKTLRILTLQQEVGLILNPLVGNYRLSIVKRHPISPKLWASGHLMPSFYFDPSFDWQLAAQQTNLYLLCNNFSYLNQHFAQLDTLAVRAVVLPNEARFRVLFSKQKFPIIYQSDPFVYETDLHNYLTHPDELFSWSHYLDRLRPNSLGFSDYAISGSFYSDFGQPQSVQAIHLTYQSAAGALRIHHFISFDNGKLTEQRAKFLDLLNQLRRFIAMNRQEIWISPALKQLLYYREIDKNPGFGTIKKLLSLHHYQLINRVFEK